MGGWLRGASGEWCAPTHSLDWALASPWLVIGVLLVVIGLNGYLFSAITKGFFPDQDNGC
jgi:multidrug efflux pump